MDKLTGAMPATLFDTRPSTPLHRYEKTRRISATGKVRLRQCTRSTQLGLTSGTARQRSGTTQVLGPAGHLGSAAMATHDVTMNLSHPITVMNVDVEFEVRADGELMGKVQISRGGIDWMPFKSHPRAATWEQFAAWMEGTA